MREDSDEVDLLVIEPHPMSEQEMRTQHAEVVEVHDRAAPGTRQVAVGVRGSGGDVHRHRAVQLAGEVRRTRQQLVASQIMTDQCHPTLDQSSGRIRLDHGPLAIEHLVGGADERPLLDVPSPRADRAADANSRHRRRHSIGVSHRARFDDCRDTVQHTLDGGEHRRDLVVGRRVLGVDRHRPLEDRLPGGDEVGYAAAHQRVAGEVLMGVDHAGGDHAIRDIDERGVGIRGAEVGGGTDRRDDATGDHHRPADEHVPTAVHRHDIATGDDGRARYVGRWTDGQTVVHLI